MGSKASRNPTAHLGDLLMAPFGPNSHVACSAPKEDGQGGTLGTVQKAAGQWEERGGPQVS